jgi:general secretion pathway protein G
MFQRIRTARENESGFTLIELLIVIVILGILAGIVVFAVGGISDRGKTSACKADKKTLEVAQEAHYAQTTPSAYAADETALVAAKLLRSASSNYDTDNTGAVTSQAGSGCP